jgi:hypothetical protein
MSIDMTQFSVAVLNAIHAPVTHQNVAALVGWQAAEGGAVHNNPFNTTQGAPGATTFNSVGVKSYPGFNTAVHATVQTLTNGRYGSIIGALKASNPHAFVSAVGSSPWGTSGSTLAGTVAAALGTNYGLKSGAAPATAPSNKQVAQGRTRTSTSSQTFSDPGVTTRTTSGGGLDAKAALLAALETPTPINESGALPTTSLLDKMMTNIDSGAYNTPVTNTIMKSAGQSTTLTTKQIAQQRASHGSVAGAGQPSKGGYVNPLPDVSVWGRTDEGVDANMPVGGKIRAPGDVKILNIIPAWTSYGRPGGQPLVYFQFLNGPLKGKVQYVAEQIENIAKVGSIVKEGGTIATYAPSGTGIEYGWATPSGDTLAKSTTGYSEGELTPAGANMRRWLNQHGANAGPSHS